MGAETLCNTSIKANRLNANMSISTGFIIRACVKGPIMAMQQVMFWL